MSAIRDYVNMVGIPPRRQWNGDVATTITGSFAEHTSCPVRRELEEIYKGKPISLAAVKIREEIITYPESSACQRIPNKVLHSRAHRTSGARAAALSAALVLCRLGIGKEAPAPLTILVNTLVESHAGAPSVPTHGKASRFGLSAIRDHNIRPDMHNPPEPGHRAGCFHPLPSQAKVAATPWHTTPLTRV